MTYVYLALSILLEVIGSSSMKLSEGFTKLIPVLVVIVAYISSFYCFSLALKTLPLGLAYAIWAGVGIVLTALIGVFVFKQNIDLPALIGMTLIVSGVVIMSVFSKTGHA